MRPVSLAAPPQRAQPQASLCAKTAFKLSRASPVSLQIMHLLLELIFLIVKAAVTVVAKSRRTGMSSTSNVTRRESLLFSASSDSCGEDCGCTGTDECILGGCREPIFASATPKAGLEAGDVAILGWNVASKTFFFMPLVTVKAGTVLWFTNAGPGVSSFATNGETGGIKFTLAQNIPAGVLVTVVANCTSNSECDFT